MIVELIVVLISFHKYEIKEKSTARPLCLVDVLSDISREKIC